ncbi:hypothetical protein [Methanosarcina mazei]|nr:hypothetical protein [Methanosarcina mazei]
MKKIPGNPVKRDFRRKLKGSGSETYIKQYKDLVRENLAKNIKILITENIIKIW